AYRASPLSQRGLGVRVQDLHLQRLFQQDDQEDDQVGRVIGLTLGPRHTDRLITCQRACARGEGRLSVELHDQIAACLACLGRQAHVQQFGHEGHDLLSPRVAGEGRVRIQLSVVEWCTTVQPSAAMGSGSIIDEILQGCDHRTGDEVLAECGVQEFEDAGRAVDVYGAVFVYEEEPPQQFVRGGEPSAPVGALRRWVCLPSECHQIFVESAGVQGLPTASEHRQRGNLQETQFSFHCVTALFLDQMGLECCHFAFSEHGEQALVQLAVREGPGCVAQCVAVRVVQEQHHQEQGLLGQFLVPQDDVGGERFQFPCSKDPEVLPVPHLEELLDLRGVERF